MLLIAREFFCQTFVNTIVILDSSDDDGNVAIENSKEKIKE